MNFSCWKLPRHEPSIPLSYGHENWIPRSGISKSFDLAGQNKVLKDPEQVCIGTTINIGRFLADFGSMLGGSGDDLGMIWACSGGFPGMFQLRKSDLYTFSKNRFFEDRWVVCTKKS